MTKILTVANRKGGVGKTLMSTLLAIYFSEYKNKRILAMDFDPSNCSMSNQFLTMESDPSDLEGKMPPFHTEFDEDIENETFDGRSSTADIFQEKPVIPYQSKYENLKVLPAYSSRLSAIERTSHSLIEEKVNQKFKNWFNSQDVQNNYDLIICDILPTKSLTSVAVFNVASYLIIPAEMSSLSMEGVFAMLQAWNQQNLIRNADNPLELLGIVPNMFQKRLKLHKGYYDSLKNNAGAGRYVTELYLKHSKFFPEYDHHRVTDKEGSVFDLPASNDVRQSCIELCEQFYKGVFNDDRNGDEQFKNTTTGKKEEAVI